MYVLLHVYAGDTYNVRMYVSGRYIYIYHLYQKKQTQFQ